MNLDSPRILLGDRLPIGGRVTLDDLFPRTAPDPAPAARPVGGGATGRPPFRLDFLDGLRGLAALYVVNHHVLQAVGWDPARSSLPGLAKRALGLFTEGHSAVGVFIVLSGYCLMLPVMKAAAGRLAGGTRGYVARRARRILPAYYGALALSVLMVAAFPVTHNWGVRTLAPAQIWSHLLLLHNLWTRTAWGINGPMWSVATEWQIYFLFPLVLLPVWRRRGTLAAVLTAFTLGAAAYAAAPDVLWRACPWYLGLFAMGMAGAVLTHSAYSSDAARAEVAALPWGRATVMLAGAVCAIAAFRPEWGWYNKGGVPRPSVIGVDALVGLATVCFIARGAFRSATPAGGVSGRIGRSRGRVVAALESRPLMALGGVSYSLYLTHIPFVNLIAATVNRYGLSFKAEYLATAGLAVPASLAVAAVMWRLFEQPFLGKSITATAAAAVPAAPDARPATTGAVPAAEIAAAAAARAEFRAAGEHAAAMPLPAAVWASLMAGPAAVLGGAAVATEIGRGADADVNADAETPPATLPFEQAFGFDRVSDMVPLARAA